VGWQIGPKTLTIALFPGKALNVPDVGQREIERADGQFGAVEVVSG
jgi:hypothetical protein